MQFRPFPRLLASHGARTHDTVLRTDSRGGVQVKKRLLHRREFISRTALGAAALCAGSRGSGATAATAATAKPKLVQVTGPEVPSNIGGALHRALEPLGGMGAFVKKGQRVLIKPNLGFPGLPEAVRDLDVKIVMPKDAILFTEVQLPHGRQLKTTEVVREALAASMGLGKLELPPDQTVKLLRAVEGEEQTEHLGAVR